MKLGQAIPIFAPVLPIELPEESATLVSIVDTPFRGERTYGVYTICGVGRCKCDPKDSNRCLSGDGYIMKIIKPRRGMIDMGDNNWTARKPGQKEPDLKNVQQFVVHAEDIASDLVREWRSDLTGIGATPTGEVEGQVVNGFTGVFIADGARPTDEELAQARQLLASCDNALIMEGDREWDQFHEPKSIHDSYKRAARRQKVDRPWLYTVVTQASLPDCPHCGSKLKTATASVCATCHRDVKAANAPEREQELVGASSGHKGGRRKSAAA